MKTLLMRYIIRELTDSTLVITSILLILFLFHEGITYFNLIGHNQLNLQTLWRLLLFQAPLFLAILLPLGFYLSILWVYGRLYAENEMLALTSSGISPLGILYFILPLLLGIVLITGYIMLSLKPMLYWERNQFITQATTHPLMHILPDQFNSLKQGKEKWVFYAHSKSYKTHHLHQIFLAQQPEAESDKNMPLNLPAPIQPWQVITAQSAYIQHNPHDQSDFIVFSDGKLYKGLPGKLGFNSVQYQHYGLRLPTLKMSITPSQRIKYLPTQALWQMRSGSSYRNLIATELQWRLAIPLSVIILTILAIPLSQVKPRQSRYAKLLPAILIYIAYMDLLLISKAWLKKGLMTPLMGLWWVHGLAGLIACLLFIRMLRS